VTSVSCPSGNTPAGWRSLVAHRAAAGGREPAGWAEALAHLDGCAACRRMALDADPTLVFRRLRAAPAVSSPPADLGESAAVQQAVAALRAASRVGASSVARRRGLGANGGWTRWAAAAVLAATALALGSTAPDRPAPAVAAMPSLPLAPTLRVEPTIATAAMTTRDLQAQPSLRPAQLPMIEELNRPDARVYQIDGGNLSVVMIVDEKLDV
jgi:hypothetical protein